MNLSKNQQEIDAAVKRSKVTPERADAIVRTIRATLPEKRDELDAIFLEHVPENEKAFYRDIVLGESPPAAPQPGEQTRVTTKPEQPK